MKDARMFVVFWLLNSALFYVAPLVAGDMVVTGNARLAPFMASIISGFLLSVALSVVQPALESLKIKVREEWHWALIYLGVNVVALWVIARYADLTGVGLANISVVVGMAIAANLLQWAGWKFVGAKK